MWQKPFFAAVFNPSTKVGCKITIKFFYFLVLILSDIILSLASANGTKGNSIIFS